MRILWVAAAALAVDAGTKWLAARWLAEKTVRLGFLLELRLTRNSGMALGLFSQSPLAGILLPLAVIFCGWLLMRRYRPTGFTRTVYGLILGGFLGNFLERLWHGYVLDMIFFPFLPWFVCNVADIVICAGVVLLGVSLLFRPQDWREIGEKNDAKDQRGSAE